MIALGAPQFLARLHHCLPRTAAYCIRALDVNYTSPPCQFPTNIIFWRIVIDSIVVTVVVIVVVAASCRCNRRSLAEAVVAAVAVAVAATAAAYRRRIISSRIVLNPHYSSTPFPLCHL